jgi:hypothetical protein
MTRARLDGLWLLFIGSAVFVVLGFSWERFTPASMVDFKGIYFGARCLIQHSDPYNASDILRIYRASELDRATDPERYRQVIATNVYPPTALPITAAIALLPWGPAHILWMALTALLFVVSAYWVWCSGARSAPRLSGLLVCILLLGSELLIEVGNPAGIAIALSAVAVCCFLAERFVLLGVACLAVSLALKPQDAGSVWLYFLLAGGAYRKRAVQTLALTVFIGLTGVLWVSSVAPHWAQELRGNISASAVPGGVNDPGPATLEPRSHSASLINLQTAVSVFRDDPRFYNPAAYLICAPLILVWLIATLRSRPSPDLAWLGLAAIAALSMLPVYHRQHDTRLLLLTVPACAMLWMEGGLRRWIAFLITAAGLALTGDIPLQLLGFVAKHLGASTAGLYGKALTVLLARPAPLFLLVIAVFYQWAYWRRILARSESSGIAGAGTDVLTQPGTTSCNSPAARLTGFGGGQNARDAH